MLTIRTSLDGVDPAGAVFVPGLRGLEGPHLDLLATLPICDVNGALLSSLEAPPWPAEGPAPVAGLFLADPFLREAEVAARLRRAGVRRLANYPTIQAFDGEAARALASVGLSFAEELAALRAFVAEGFGAVGFAAGAAAARELAALGASAVVLHPGPGSQPREREALAAMAGWLGPELAARGVDLLLFEPRRATARPVRPAPAPPRPAP
ncbi:MAG TPA: phosphoenolpyruvate hydrolase family protein [Beijerinckiaceae bacterium]|nr:phosphoenolpyruvate hydrolase family protein [Beijerinckiaceae bacterium]